MNKMRMSPFTLKELSDRMTPLDTPERRNDYLTGNFPRSEFVTDLDVRYRWDLYWAAEGREVTRNMDLTTNHVDTALRNIVAPLA